jgi:electron transfer flavoprotein alpha subunit
MSILVFAEADGGKIKKSSIEAVCFAKLLSDKTGGDVVVFCADETQAGELESLGKYGASKVLKANHEALSKKMVSPTASALAQAANQIGAKYVVMSRSSLTDPVAPRLGIKLGASVASNLAALPVTGGGEFQVKRGVYTGKAFAYAKVKGEKIVMTIQKNAVGITEFGGSASVEDFSANISDKDLRVKTLETHKQTGQVLLPDAEIVVSGGRGLKGPEHWGIIEDLAKVLGAATGCSKPVSDLDWRPHHEHVGQTGVKVSPNLYFAIGISGAIQHLAGVSSSKCIVAINKDPEAPFFKAADYGIVGDAFEVVPKLTEAIKASI